MPAPKTGHQAKLYRNTGTDAAPVLQEICGVTDVNLSGFSIVTAQFEVRCNENRFSLASIGDTITASFRYTPGVQQFVYNDLLTDFLARTPRQYAILSGEATSADEFGFVIPFLIKTFPWEQPLLQVTNSEIELEGLAYIEEGGVALEAQYFDSIIDWGATIDTGTG